MSFACFLRFSMFGMGALRMKDHVGGHRPSG